MHIMVVDDEDDIVKMTAMVFELHDHKATRASSGSECLKILEAGIRPDAILLDIMMPDMSGFETCVRIKADERFKKIPVIILTAKPPKEAFNQGMKAGASAFISKPFEPDELIKQVEIIISGVE